MKKLLVLIAVSVGALALSNAYGFGGLTTKTLGGTPPSPTIDEQVLSRGPI